MPKLATPLTETQIVNLKPRTKRYCLGDGKGLYLLVMPSGDKYWRMGATHLGKETTLSGGMHPEVSLLAARQWRESMQNLIDAGIKPNVQKREQRMQLQAAKSKPSKLQFVINDQGGMVIDVCQQPISLDCRTGSRS